MRRILSACALVCALSLPALAGDPHLPGDTPVCPPDTTCPASAPADSIVDVIVDGVLLIFNLLP